jgi:isoleucyl-tRNA synthetase
VATLQKRWSLVREVRANVQKELELLRVKGEIGSALAAEVEVLASGDRYQALAALQDDLRFVLITSQARVVEVGSDAEEMIKVRASTDPKCPRCWHYRADVGADATHPELCGRCVANLYGAGSHAAMLEQTRA